MFALWIIQTTETPSKPNLLPPTGEVVGKSDAQGEEFAGPFDLDTAWANATEFNEASIAAGCPLWAIVLDESEKLKKGQKIKLEAARQGKVKLYTAGQKSPLLTTGNPMNEQEKEELTKLVMAESRAFDALLEGLANHPALLAKAIEVHKIHERIGVALGILH